MHCSQHSVLALTFTLHKMWPSQQVLVQFWMEVTNWKCDKWLQLTLYHVSLLTHSFQCKPVSMLHKSPAWTDSSKGCYHTLCSNIMQVPWSWYYCNVQYLYFTFANFASAYSIVGVAHRGVVIINNCSNHCTIESNLGELSPHAAVMEVSMTL